MKMIALAVAFALAMAAGCGTSHPTAKSTIHDPGPLPPQQLHGGIGGARRCRSCKAVILWAVMTSGKKAPFEADVDDEWMIENGVARHVGKPTKQLELGGVPEPRFTSHFARCPQRDEWRKERDDA